MYAIIRAGGKQHKVAKGDVIEVERLKDESVEFVPLLVVDDDGTVHSGKEELAGARVRATVLGETKGPKVHVLHYRNKTGYRKNTGHRQTYTSIEISDIKLGGGRSRGSAREEEKSDGS